MAERADVERALAVLDTYNRQIEALGRQLSFLQAVLAETVQAGEALKGLRKEKSQDILVPLGSNTFIYATASRKDRVLTGIGASLSVEKSWEDAEARLARREEEVQAEIGRLSEAVVRLQQEAAALQEDIEQDLARARGGAEGRTAGG